MQTVQLGSVLDVIRKLKQERPDLNHYSHLFKVSAARISEELNLPASQLINLALHLGVRWFPKPVNIPDTWKIVLCKKFLSQRYNNPTNPEEYVVIKSPNSYGGLPYIIHKTSEGYAENRWFTEVIPNLNELLAQAFSDCKYPYTEDFNTTVNQFFENAQNGKGMTVGQVAAFNLFFDKYVPGLEGICTNCFRVSLPNSGAGERWVILVENMPLLIFL